MLIEEERLVQEDDPVSAPASLRIRARLDSMRNLADGWLEGAGIAPSPGGLDWLAEAFARQYPEEISPTGSLPDRRGWRAGRVVLRVLACFVGDQPEVPPWQLVCPGP